MNSLYNISCFFTILKWLNYNSLNINGYEETLYLALDFLYKSQQYGKTLNAQVNNEIPEFLLLGKMQSFLWIYKHNFKHIPIIPLNKALLYLFNSTNYTKDQIYYLEINNNIFNTIWNEYKKII